MTPAQQNVFAFIVSWLMFGIFTVIWITKHGAGRPHSLKQWCFLMLTALCGFISFMAVIPWLGTNTKTTWE